MTLDAGNDRLVLDAAPHPAPTADELLALLPGWVRRASSPLRDAILQAVRRTTEYAWARLGATLAAAQSPRNAAGLSLDAHGEALHRPRVTGELDADYRLRLLTNPAIVSPDALRAAVTGLVEPETGIVPALFEPATDGLFVARASGCAWHAFVQRAGTPTLWGEYPDNANPYVGAYPTPAAQVGLPVFWVVVPGELADDPTALLVGRAGDAADPTKWTDGNFIGRGATPSALGYVGSPAGLLVDRVIRDVESRRGGGVVWVLLVDPQLGGAK